jgi:hypothetical protein
MIRAYVWAGANQSEAVGFGAAMPWAFGAITALFLTITVCVLAKMNRSSWYILLFMIIPELFICIAGCVSGAGFARSCSSLNYYKTLPTLYNTTYQSVIDRPDIFVYTFREPLPAWQTQYGYENTITSTYTADDGTDYTTYDYYYCMPMIEVGTSPSRYPVSGCCAALTIRVTRSSVLNFVKRLRALS